MLAPYEEVVTAIEGGAVRPLYLLSGPSHLAASAVRTALLDAWVEPERRALDAPLLQGSDTNWTALVDALRMPSWTGGRRVVTLDEPPGLAPRRGRQADEDDSDGKSGEDEDAQSTSGPEPLLAYLAAPLPDVTVVLRCRVPADRRRKDVKALIAKGAFVDCRQPLDRALKKLATAEAQSWLERRFEREGRRMQPGLAARVVERVGADLDRLDREAEKMLLFSDERLLGEAVLEVVSGNADEDIFKLMDAIGARDPGRTESELATLESRGENPLGVLALLASQVRIMRVGKDVVEGGGSLDEATALLGAHPFRVRMAVGQARSFTAQELDDALESIWQAEWNIKSGEWPDRDALEWTVARMLGASGDRPTPRFSRRSSGTSASSARRRE